MRFHPAWYGMVWYGMVCFLAGRTGLALVGERTLEGSRTKRNASSWQTAKSALHRFRLSAQNELPKPGPPGPRSCVSGRASIDSPRSSRLIARRHPARPWASRHAPCFFSLPCHETLFDFWLDASQVLEAWCSKAKAFAGSGLRLDGGSDPPGGSEGGDAAVLLRHSLSQVRV